LLLATFATARVPAAQASELVPTASIAGDATMAIPMDIEALASLAAGDQAASLLAGTETLGYICYPYGTCGSYIYGYPYFNSSWYYPYASYPYGYYPYVYSPYSYGGYYAPYWTGYSWPYYAWYW
jgi:hypothetical protein